MATLQTKVDNLSENLTKHEWIMKEKEELITALRKQIKKNNKMPDDVFYLKETIVEKDKELSNTTQEIFLLKEKTEQSKRPPDNTWFL